MTNNPLRKAKKKVKEKKAKYEVNPSPELKQDIKKWEEKVNTLIKCQIKGPSKKKESSDKTDEQLFNEANAYNRLHRNDNDVKVKEEKMKISKDLEKKKGILRKTINEKLENEKKKYEEEVSNYTKEKEEFESMKQKAMEEIMEKENVNKYKASLRFKEEYEKHIQYTLVIKEIMQHSNCSQEEAESLFKQISLQKSQMKEGVPQIENEQYSDEPIPE